MEGKKVVVKKTVKVVNTKNHNLSNVTFVTKTTNQNNDMVSIKPKEDNEEKKELSMVMKLLFSLLKIRQVQVKF